MEDEYKDTISPEVRKAIYWVYFAVTLIVGSCQAYVAAIGAAQPNWITGALAVLAYAGAMLGLQAAVFTPKTPVSAVKPVDDGVATIEPVGSPVAASHGSSVGAVTRPVTGSVSSSKVEYSSGSLVSSEAQRPVIRPDVDVIDPLNP